MNATANVPGTFVYSPAAGTVLKAGTQTLSVLFTPTDAKTYSSGTATVQLSVSQAAPTISWPAPAAIAQGMALSSLQLDANANVPGSFAYSPAAGVVPAAGTLQLSATFTPTDTTDYSSPTAHNTLSVTVSPTPPTPLGTFGYTGSALVSTLVPPNSATPISSDFFGMTIYNLADTAGQTTSLTAFPPYQLATLRLWDVAYWAFLEPANGLYVWNKMDGTITVGQQNGVSDFIFTFGQPPKWASTNPTDPCTDGEGPGTCSPPDLNAYEDFATHVVQRYCGKVKYYEPWNEPNNLPFWDGDNAQMLTLARTLYRIAKDPANCGCTNGGCSPNGGVNPNKVLLPPISGGAASIPWLDSYLASAGTVYPYADIATFHGYVWAGYPPEDIVGIVQSLRQTLAKYGLSDLELWNTEAG